jgi:squalene-hopene/tetraprenyl-beta-curcumene cyclase
MAGPAQRSLVEEALKQQQPDGGWTIESLGSWKKHAQASPAPLSNSYATGFVAFVLQTAGVSHSNPDLRRALEWLRSRQDPESGSWAADSMNKRYEPDSMPARFMRDAATAFAALALLDPESKH